MSPPKDASTTGNGTGASGAVSTINDWIDPTTLETGSDVSVPTMLRATLEAVDVVEQQAADLEEILEALHSQHTDELADLEQLARLQQNSIEACQLKMNRYEFSLKEALSCSEKTLDRVLQKEAFITTADGGPDEGELRSHITSKMPSEPQFERQKSTVTERKVYLLEEKDICELRLAIKYLRHAEKIHGLSEKSDRAELSNGAARSAEANRLAAQAGGTQQKAVINVTYQMKQGKDPDFFTDLEQPTEGASRAKIEELVTVTKSVTLALPSSILEDPIAITIPADSTCADCKSLLDKQDQLLDERTHLKHGIEVLAQQLVQETDLRQEMDFAKSKLEHELEDLTAVLFDQANKMVSEEASMRHQLEQANKSLHGRLEETMNASKTREEELKELKRKLQRLDNAKKKSALTNQSAHSGSTQLRYAAEGNDHGSVSNLSHGRHASHSNFQISVGSGATGEDGVATAKRALVGSPASSFTENTRDTLKLPGLKVTKRSSDASFASSTPDLTIMRKSRVPSFVVSHQPERRRTTTQLLPLTGDQLLRGPTTLKVFLDLILFREFQEFVNLTQHTTQPSSALTTVSTIGHLLQTTSGTPFLKRCLTEDVQPCLAHMGDISGMKKSFGWRARRQLIDAVLDGSCSIQPVTLKPTSQTASSYPDTRCHACGFIRECEYRLKVTERDIEDAQQETASSGSNLSSIAQQFFSKNFGSTASPPPTTNSRHFRSTSEGGRASNAASKPATAEPIRESVESLRRQAASVSAETPAPVKRADTAPFPLKADMSSNSGSEGWFYIDRFCRDKIVAVCEFLSYLSHIQNGLVRIHFIEAPIEAGIYRTPTALSISSSSSSEGGASRDPSFINQLPVSSAPPPPMLPVMNMTAQTPSHVLDSSNGKRYSLFEAFRNVMVHRRRINLARVGSPGLFDLDPAFGPGGAAGAGTIISTAGKTDEWNIEVVLLR